MTIKTESNTKVWIVRAPAERREFVRVIQRDNIISISSRNVWPTNLVASWTRDGETGALLRAWRFDDADETGSSRPRWEPLPLRRGAA